MHSSLGKHLVFISYSSKDFQIASSTQNFLESQGINCWMAPGSIRPGEQWADAIARVIPESSMMILLWTNESMRSRQVINELTLADRSGVLVIPFRLENIEPEGAFKYYLYKTHWLDAVDNAWQSKLQLLADRVKHNLPESTERDQPKQKAPQKREGRNVRNNLSIAAIATCFLIALPFVFPKLLQDNKQEMTEIKAKEAVQARAVDSAVAIVQDLYFLLTDKQYDRARQLLRPEISRLISNSFFDQFDRITVQDIKTTGITSSTVNLEGVVVFVWPDGSLQKESRSFTVKTVPKALITGSEFGKIIQSR